MSDILHTVMHAHQTTNNASIEDSLSCKKKYNDVEEVEICNPKKLEGLKNKLK